MTGTATALWCDPWQVHTLPCGCAARQPDWSETWEPLRPCRAHDDLTEWALVLRTLPEAGGSIFQPLPPRPLAPYEQEVRCRCCNVRLDLTPCDCTPKECLCDMHLWRDWQPHCVAHCQVDDPRLVGDHADGHPEPDEDITW